MVTLFKTSLLFFPGNYFTSQKSRPAENTQVSCYAGADDDHNNNGNEVYRHMKVPQVCCDEVDACGGGRTGTCTAFKLSRGESFITGNIIIHCQRIHVSLHASIRRCRCTGVLWFPAINQEARQSLHGSVGTLASLAGKDN